MAIVPGLLVLVVAAIGSVRASGLDLVLNTYHQCEGQADALGCLKLQAVKVMHRALDQDQLPIADGLALVRSGGESSVDAKGDRGRALSASDLEGELAGMPAERRQERLDEVLADHAARLLSSRTLSLSVPRLLASAVEAVDDGEAVETGREKGGLGGGGGGLKKGGKKGSGAILLALLMKGGMLAYAYKALALLAGKALLVAKVALVLASVIGLSHLVGHKGHGHGGTTYEIVKHPVVSHGYSHSQAVLGDDHHHFDVSSGHGGGFGGGSVGGGGGGYGGHGWGRAGLPAGSAAVGRSMGDSSAPASSSVAPSAPQSQLIAPDSAEPSAAPGGGGGGN